MQKCVLYKQLVTKTLTNYSGSLVMLLVLLLSLFGSVSVLAQETIEAKLEYKKNVKFQFTDEWQYLSTDLYLFNGNKFGRVVNKLASKKPKKNEFLEYLYISAKMKNITIFGNEDVVYPIYNFQIQTDKAEYKTQIGDNLEVIRVIDKLPLASNNEFIDAEINIKAISNNQSLEMLTMVANQLISISSIKNPTGAVMSLVREYGNLIQTNTTKREYKFSSTIRLYEEQNFDMRLHSIRLYVFLPTGADPYRLNTDKLDKFLEANDNPEIGRKQLETLLNFADYPYLVVVNYKSLYQMDVITGDEISQETIQNRKLKIENARTLGLIKDEPYRQEKYFIEYLEIFNDLKSSMNLYKLNYEIKNTEALSKNIFTIIQNFNRLKTTYNHRLEANKTNTTFLNLFKSEYEVIFSTAELYLEKDVNLKNCKELVNTLFELDQRRNQNLKPEDMDAYLRKLYSIELPDSAFLSTSAEGKLITEYSARFERGLFTEVYDPEIRRLSRTQANDNTIEQRNQLRNMVKATNCRTCRTHAIEAINAYNERYEVYKVGLMQAKLDSVVKAADQKMFDFMEWKDCISKNLQKEEITTKLGAVKERVVTKHNELSEMMTQLDKKISEKRNFKKEEEVLSFIENLKVMVADIETGYNYLCQRYDYLCDCKAKNLDGQ